MQQKRIQSYFSTFAKHLNCITKMFSNACIFQTRFSDGNVFVLIFPPFPCSCELELFAKNSYYAKSSHANSILLLLCENWYHSFRFHQDNEKCNFFLLRFEYFVRNCNWYLFSIDTEKKMRDHFQKSSKFE